VPADAVVVHGHVYQPPRADPRTGVVPVEPTAAPFHDWNARITAECYRPNAFARIFDDQGRITKIVNNYERMSFDLGPTLSLWLADHAPEVLARMVAGDHPRHTAIAHPFHHSILPLAEPRDAVTELRWGAAEFRHRFGREPKGMWLPEAAIDPAVAAMLITEGYEFTVLAPHQVERHPGAGRFGRTAAGLGVVVYDGAVSHDLAFGSLLADSGAMVDRLSGGLDGGVAVAAVDAETFGHHHHFTERGIAHALFELAPRRGLATGPLADLFRAAAGSAGCVDVGEVTVSSWSCAHGLGRWREDCGCSTDGGPGFNQAWRAPLRNALDLLRDHSNSVFERRGSTVFHDPWQARDAYGAVLADPAAWPEFIERHVRPMESHDEARILLAAQEATLASFTSCAWFFADLARREVAIVLQEAVHAADLLARLGEPAPLDIAQGVLAEARSNDPALPTGRDVWEWALQPVSTEAPPTAPAPPLQPLLDRLIEESASSATAAEQATALIAAAAGSGNPLDLTRAQERVYDDLANHAYSRELLGSLGFAPEAGTP
jgi:hypothetical protein